MTSMATMSAGRTVSFPWGMWRLTISSRWRNFQSHKPNQTSPKRRGLVQPTESRRYPHDIGIIGQGDGLGIGEEAKLPVFPWRL